MPGFTYIHYSGDDKRILELVTNLVSGNGGGGQNPPPDGDGNGGSGDGSWDGIAMKFAGYVAKADAEGNPAQQNAMLAWLKADGEIHLSKLWKAAGVRVQHDYSGVGSSLTKNMKKAGGPKTWYSGSPIKNGEWLYKINPDLVASLKRSFGVK
ncbi:MAG: hypothetical protein JWQ87_3922 [Candidatus Sulfotelmatobacter sp.]|nr:hypothetical protein [Candidatus Sulfotelmatobacter sp.]